MKPVLTTFFLSVLCGCALQGRANASNPPSTVEFQGRTYFVEQSINASKGTFKLMLYYPNLPDYDNEYYENYPERTRDGGAVTEIRFGDWASETGQITVLGSLNSCLNGLDPFTYPLNSEGKLSYFMRERRQPGFGLGSWSYAENRGFGFYEDGTHFYEKDYAVHIKENNGKFTFHKIPRLTVEMLRQVETEKLENLNFGVLQIEALEPEEEEQYLADLKEVVGQQEEWNLPEDLMKINGEMYYINIGGGDTSVSDSYIAYHFAPDGAVSLKGLFYFPYPGKEQMLKLYLNATGDNAGEKEWRAEEDSGPLALLQRYPEAYDLGGGKFALYGKFNTWNN